MTPNDCFHGELNLRGSWFYEVSCCFHLETEESPKLDGIKLGDRDSKLFLSDEHIPRVSMTLEKWVHDP